MEQVACQHGFSTVINAILMEDEGAMAANHESMEGWTGLMKAAMYNKPQAIHVLASTYRADPDYVSKYGKTALMIAVGQGHSEAAKALLECGADPDKKVRGVTARSMALNFENRDIIEMCMTVRPPLTEVKRLEPIMKQVELAERRAEESRKIQGVDW